MIRQITAFAELLDLDARRIAGWAAVKAVAWDFGLEHAVLLAEVDAALA